MRIAVIDKAPSRNNYSDHFNFEFDLLHMSEVPIPKLLKKDVTLDFDPDLYDYVILVGSEAAKHYAKITSVTSHAGLLVDNKYMCISNPAMLVFKPEMRPDFERALNKIHGTLNGIVTNAAVSGDYKWIANADEAYDYLLEVYNSDVSEVAVDTETTALYPRDGYVLGISMSHMLRQGRYLVSDILDSKHLELMQKIFDKYTVVFHNMKFDYKMLAYHFGFRFNRDNVHDTMVMHYVLDETDSHGLKQLALKYTDFGDYDSELDDFKKEYCAKHGILQEDFTYDLIPLDVIGRYAAIDTAVTLELYRKFLPLILKNSKLEWVYRNILIRGTLFLMDMEEVGIPIGVDRMKAAGTYLFTQISAAKEKVFSFPEVKQYEKDENKIFNPGSVVQLRKVLFDYVGLTPTGKLTKAGAVSTDAEVLKELADQHPLPRAILELRALTKISSSYVSKILPEIDNDGRIRTNFNLIFTTSGRLSSSGKFNAQQIPRDDPIIKGCLVAPAGYSIVSQDLTTAEVYYAAVLSGDKNLQAVFSSGGDLHSTIAKMVFNLPCEVDDVKKLYPSLRQAAKAIN